MLDQEDVQQSEIADTENIDPRLLSRMNRMSLNAVSENVEKDIDVEGYADNDRKLVENLLTIDNPVFNDDRISSKVMIVYYSFISFIIFIILFVHN